MSPVQPAPSTCWGHVHGKLVHGLDLGVDLAVIQDQPEFGGPAAEPDRLVLPGNLALLTGGLWSRRRSEWRKGGYRTGLSLS